MEKDYKKEQALYKKLGAERFQKVVLKLEKSKFKLEKKLFPNLIKTYEKRLDKKKTKELKKATSEEEKQIIIAKYKLNKMIVRSQYNNNENINYHMSSLKPTMMYQFAKMNKDIHIRSIKKDIIIALSSLGLSFINPLFLIVLAYELLSMFIDFECINLQNYTMSRMEEKEEIIKKIEQRKLNSEIKSHGEAAKVISKTIEQSEDVPEPSKIIDNIDNIEQLKQIKDMLLKTYEKRQNQRSGEKIYDYGK